MLFRKVDLGLVKRFRKINLCLLCLFLSFGLLCLNGYLKHVSNNYTGYSIKNHIREQPLVKNRRHNRNLQHLYDDELAVIKDISQINTHATDVIQSYPNEDKYESPTKNKTAFSHLGVTGRKSSEIKRKNNHSLVKRLPNAIIIGVKKGGTRALLEFLRSHPYVKATGPEPHFFDKHFNKGLDWYRNLMPKSEPFQLTIEKTPAYFVTKDVPGRVYNMSKSTKLIIVVRDPVTRCVSDFTQIMSRSSHPQTFEQQVLSNNRSTVDTSRTIVKVGMYSDHLTRWLKYFPLEQIHIVDGENLVTYPWNEMRKVQNFLNIPVLIEKANFSFNKLRGFPCIKRKIGIKPHCLDETKGRKHPLINSKTLNTLRIFYQPFNKVFSDLAGQEFSWT